MKLVFLSLPILFLSACNNQNIAIRGLDLHTHEEDGATYVDLESIVSLGTLKLSNTNSSIKNADQKDIGEVSIQQLDDGTDRIAVTVNYDEVEKMDTNGFGKTLPNGRETPLVLGNSSPLFGVSVLQNSRVYVGADSKGSLFAGIALNIPAFDHILTKVPTALNLFMPFPFSNEETGVAGIYSSPTAGENGLAIFAKKSQQPTNTPSLQAEVAPTEIEKVDRLTLFRLNYLFTKHATLRIK